MPNITIPKNKGIYDFKSMKNSENNKPNDTKKIIRKRKLGLSIK